MNRLTDFVFDLDGTISNPLTGIHRCMNYALSSEGLTEVDRATVARIIGPPLDAGFRELVPELDDRTTSRLVVRYRERYIATGYAENELYDGVPDILATMSERGLRMGICTSKRTDYAEKIVQMFGMRDLFEFVDGGDIGVPKSRQLEGLKKSGIVDEQSTMIGDRAVDIAAARTNGLTSIGVLWGFGPESELRKAGADAIVSTPNELATATAA